MLTGDSKRNEMEIQINSKSQLSSTVKNMILNCSQCNSWSISDSDRCGQCNNLLCNKCSQVCLNTSYDHRNNYFCSKCFPQCVMCEKVKQCVNCIKRCFSKNCTNTLCQPCLDKNKHQLRSENVNCNFFRCENCQTDGNCIMTTVYCSPCDKRICRKCFYAKHFDHKR